MPRDARVVAVSRSPRQRLNKGVVDAVLLVEGHGVEGDAHAGLTVQHRSRRRWSPRLPNLRQVHLLHAELLDETAGGGFDVSPGASRRWRHHARPRRGEGASR